jgi:hypothetical protein
MRLLLYLEFRQLVNYIVVTLRTPKRLIPFLLMVGWIALMMLPRLLMTGHRMIPPPFPGGSAPQLPALQMPEAVPAVLFFLLSTLMVYQIIRSFTDSLIVFGLPDIDFLFPSPITRRAIMALKLLGLYVRIGAYVVFFIVFAIPQVRMLFHAGGSIFMAWLGASLFAAFLVNVCTVINLVSTFRPGGRWWLSVAVRGVAMGLLLLVLGSVAYIGMRTGSYAEGALLTLRNPVITTLLMPARWTADLLLSSFTGWRPGLGGELGMMALLAGASFGLVLTRKENPYEPSLGVSARAATMRAARRTGGFGRVRAEEIKKRMKSSDVRSAVMPFGRGAMALVWKNLNVSVRTSRAILIGAPVLVAVLLIGSRVAFPGEVDNRTIEMISSGLLAYVVFFSSMFMLQAFRSDLKMANILKPMPIASWQIVAAQCVQGALVVTYLSWTLVILVALVYGLTPDSLLILGALALPVVTYALLSWQAAASILYPRWEDPTQQYLGGLISMAAGAVALGPCIVAGVVGHLLHLNVVLLAFAVDCAAVGMSIIGIALSGYLYSRYDPTDE